MTGQPLGCSWFPLWWEKGRKRQNRQVEKRMRGVFSRRVGEYLRFSELNSDSRNLRNCSRPTGSLRTSSMPNAHLFTLCWLGSLLRKNTPQKGNTSFHR
ncbi:hypothetical protein EYF80_019155 [Liparis tanakae]|uniref:Uncharacterized protein n=1 Tax=Liparis tanakae TaxID=230148 RepID=A0A4Z2HYC1_9TELE|nr:hypothetical protein EYF80_019155 [Liparis tanakae]